MEPGYPSESAQSMSFLDKLTNIIASPGDLFENVRQTGPTHSNWLIPWIIYVVVSIGTGQLILGNPSLSVQLKTTIREQFNKSIESAIIEGQITQEQADQQFEQFASPDSPWFTMFAIGGTLFGSIAILFLLSLVGLMLGKAATNTSVPYMKVVEVIGLTFIISSLERIVTTALVFMTDSIHASPSLALFLSEVDLQSTTDLALSKMNLFTFWDIGITSLGLAKLFEKDFLKILVLVVVLWILWTAFSLFSGFTLGG